MATKTTKTTKTAKVTKATKATKATKKTDEKSDVAQLRKDYYEHKKALMSGKSSNSSKLREIRKEIARALTNINKAKGKQNE
jgi:ribosomal protein L29